MRQEPNEKTHGQTGDPVKYAGQYAAIGCCRTLIKVQQGGNFPNCPQHGATTWGWIPAGEPIGLADAT